jgi:large subunit ribosomal protein L9
MQIILQKDIKNLGKKFDVKNVKDGYASHYLVPQKLAIIATSSAIASLKVKKEKWSKEEEALREKIQKLSLKIKGEHLKFKVKHSAGVAYGSIGEKDIKETLEKLGYSHLNVTLASSFKTLGDYEARIVFDGEVESKIKISLLSEDLSA